MGRKLLVLFVAALGGSCVSLQAAGPVEAYLGSWDIKILETGDTFPSAWLKIEKEPSALKGFMVWKWGSVTPCKKVEVRDGELFIERGNAVFRARLVGEELLGWTRPKKKKGRALYFVGRRAPELCDPVGTWVLKSKEDPSLTARLIIRRKGKKLSGKGIDSDGQEYPLERIELKGNRIFVRAAAAQGGKLYGKGAIKGDLIELTVEGDILDGPVNFTGHRIRKWGKPIKLFNGKDLEGWRPRDPRKRFGWHVEGGSFTNSPPDVDIVSVRKFKDFKLHLEYKVNAHSNSGCYLRGRYELQILGDPRVMPHGNMAVYSRLAPKKNPMRPMGEWQSLDVTLIGRYLTVVLNGVVIHDNAYLEGITGGALDPWEGEPGPLMLQGDHGKVWFRNVVVTPAE